MDTSQETTKIELPLGFPSHAGLLVVALIAAFFMHAGRPSVKLLSVRFNSHSILLDHPDSPSFRSGTAEFLWKASLNARPPTKLRIASNMDPTTHEVYRRYIPFGVGDYETMGYAYRFPPPGDPSTVQEGLYVEPATSTTYHHITGNWYVFFKRRSD